MTRRGLALMMFLASSSFATHAVAKRRFSFGRGILRGTTRKQYSSDVLSVDQLRKCISLENELDSVSSSLDQSRIELDAHSAELSKMQMSLRLEEIAVDVYNQESVDQYNNSIADFRRKQDDYNYRVESYNSKLEVARTLNSDFNFRCANKKYYEDDMEAARLLVP
jgi:predicted  nucleic acid-binding Zn-ribbon protein